MKTDKGLKVHICADYSKSLYIFFVFGLSLIILIGCDHTPTHRNGDEEPAWSPDGKRIAYVYNRNIYKINVETKEIKQLTTWGSCFFYRSH